MSPNQTYLWYIYIYIYIYISYLIYVCIKSLVSKLVTPHDFREKKGWKLQHGAGLVTCQLMGEKSVDPLPQCGELRKAASQTGGEFSEIDVGRSCCFKMYNLCRYIDLYRHMMILCVYGYVYICKYEKHVNVYICRYMCIYVHMHVCTHTHICIYTHMYICKYVYGYVYIYIYVCIKLM